MALNASCVKLRRDVSGRDLVRALCQRWGYAQVHQTGSHVILETATPAPQRISVPAHDELRVGTLNAILRSVARHKGCTRDEIIDSL
jgi:predicted RNA binding protein YcfA (HicA-like mRNA interferase family)